MHKSILALAVTLCTSGAFAAHTCDTVPKHQRDNCWSSVISAEQHSADEYVFAVQESKKVPASVKRKVEAKRKAISADARDMRLD